MGLRHVGVANVLTSAGGAPAQIGLHGTDEPHGVGTNASEGCVRLPNVVVTRLLAYLLPLGTPVAITSERRREGRRRPPPAAPY